MANASQDQNQPQKMTFNELSPCIKATDSMPGFTLESHRYHSAGSLVLLGRISEKFN